MKYLIIAAVLFTSTSAMAITECSRAIERIYVDGNGEKMLWINYKNGLGSARIGALTSSNFDTLLSVALAAKLADRNLVVRYAANGVDCNSSVHREDLIGFWML